MDESQRERVKVLLAQMLDLPVEQRNAFLEEFCVGDASLLHELESLLAHADEATEFFDELVEGILPEASTEPPRISGSFSGHQILHYEVLERLGGGGMGVVFKAKDTKLDRMVALKFLTHVLSTDEEAKRRFILEAKAASALDHPNIGTIYEVNETKEGQFFIAMAYYEGETLKDVIARGVLPVEQAVDFACQIAAGLAQAHEVGIVHRDIKPANVMITADGRVKIVDFGLAKMKGGDQLTKTGMTMGTLAYMSPEQIQGEEVDHQGDLWALGVILFEMLSGRRPFKGAYEGALLYSIAYEEPEDLVQLRAEVPKPIVLLVRKLLQKEVGLRVQQAEDVIVALKSNGVHLEETQKQGRLSHLTYMWPVTAIVAVILIAIFVMSRFSKDDGVRDAEAVMLDNTRVAILPFDIRVGDGDSNLREDMVEALHLAIQGTEELSSIDPNAMFVYTDGDVMASKDPSRGNEIAEHFGAGWYVISRVSRLGEQFRMTPRLYKTNGQAIDLEPVLMNDKLYIQHAADTLAQRIVGTVLDKPGYRLPTLAAQTTDSPEAFEHFMAGQRLFRSKRYEEAREAFESALALDSTFALAAFENGHTWFYIDQGNVPASNYFLKQAERHIDKLPLPVQWLLSGMVYRAVYGEPDLAEQLYRKYLDQYPDDGYALIALGDLLYHFNPMRGRSAWESKPYFEKGYQIVRSDRDDALLHLGYFYFQEGNFDQYIWTREQRDSIRGRQEYEHNSTYLTMRLAEPEDRGPYIDSLAKAKYPFLTLGLYLNIRDIRGALRANTFEDEPTRSHNEVRFRAMAGQFEKAHAIRFDPDSNEYGLNLLSRTRIAASPWSPFSTEEIKEIRYEVFRWDPGKSPFNSSGRIYENAESVKDYLLGLLSFRLQDDSTLTHVAERASQRAGEGNGKDMESAVSNILHVLQSAREGDVEKAIQSFHAARVPLPTFWYTFQSPLTTQDYSRLVIAELLFKEQRYEEALPWYDSIFSGWDTDGIFHAAPTNYRKGQIHEILGNTEEAITAYTRCIDYWRDADTALQPIVQDAQDRLNSLLQATVLES